MTYISYALILPYIIVIDLNYKLFLYIKNGAGQGY